jgi:hypothetical protein
MKSSRRRKGRARDWIHWILIAMQAQILQFGESKLLAWCAGEAHIANPCQFQVSCLYKMFFRFFRSWEKHTCAISNLLLAATSPSSMRSQRVECWPHAIILCRSCTLSRAVWPVWLDVFFLFLSIFFLFFFLFSCFFFTNSCLFFCLKIIFEILHTLKLFKFEKLYKLEKWSYLKVEWISKFQNSNNFKIWMNFEQILSFEHFLKIWLIYDFTNKFWILYDFWILNKFKIEHF